MEKRVLLAVFLSFLVLFLYHSFLAPVPEPRVPPETPPAEIVRPEPAPPDPAVPVSPPEPALVAVEPDPLVGDTEAREILVETPHLTAIFSNRGGQLQSWRLKHYHDDHGQPLELVPQLAPPGQPRPFSLAVEDANLTRRLNETFYRASAERVDVGEAPETLVFEYRDAIGLAARKEYRFDPGVSPYVVTFSASVEHQEQVLNPWIRFGPGLGENMMRDEQSWYYQKPQGVYFAADGIVRLAPKAVREQPVREGRFEYAGVNDHYFLSAALQGGRLSHVAFEPVEVHPPGAPARELMAFEVRIGEGPVAVPIFMGPKDFDLLAEIDRNLVRVINFGWLSFIVVPLLRALKWVHGYANNYGWAIVILTILINAAMFPLRHKSVVSMRKMQELQPEVKAIQERYGKLKVTDPERQKMNVEMMNLYREKGVNPLSGCLPMLLTMPVLLSFYYLLSMAIEIRGAPFVLWITDLSTHDPLYVTPILMGLSMLWQQRLMPTTADPMQQRIMLMMPVVFTFFFLWAPSGLVLYWLVSNVWTIGQQLVTNKIIGPPMVRVVRPPAERRLKKAGAGRTAPAAQKPARERPS
jgi:YidC/Oxa1 family membrane protein insertase